MKKMRLTRRAYKRKLIMFGASIFAALSLTATGFASWVLSNDVQKEEFGNIEVGTITEANIGIENINFVDDVKTFAFEPQEDDESGRVRNDGESFENLTVKLGWTVTNYSRVGTHTITFKVHENIKAAVDAGYITMPVGFTLTDKTETVKVMVGEQEVEKTYYTATYTVNKVTATGVSDDGILKYTVNTGDNVETSGYTEVADSVSFELTLTFGWGTTFGGQNPGIYYDSDAVGKAVSYDDMKATLEAFRAAVYGEEEAITYYITLAATVA